MQVALLHSLYDTTSVEVYRAGGDHTADARGSGGGGGAAAPAPALPLPLATPSYL